MINLVDRSLSLSFSFFFSLLWPLCPGCSAAHLPLYWARPTSVFPCCSRAMWVSVVADSCSFCRFPLFVSAPDGRRACPLLSIVIINSLELFCSFAAFTASEGLNSDDRRFADFCSCPRSSPSFWFHPFCRLTAFRLSLDKVGQPFGLPFRCRLGWGRAYQSLEG